MDIKRDLLLFALSFVILVFTGCVNDTLTPENPDDIKKDEQLLYLTAKISLAGGSDTKSSTEPDGKSDEDPNEYPGFDEENVIDHFNLYFFEKTDFTYDDGYQYDEKYLFTCSTKQTIDFNLTDNFNTKIELEVSPYDLNLIAGKNNIRVYATANYTYDYFYECYNWLIHPTQSYKNDYTYNPLLSYMNISQVQVAAASMAFLDEFPYKDGENTYVGKKIPMTNDDYIDLNFSGLSENDIEVYIEKMYSNEDITELTTKINNAITTSFNKTINLKRGLARIDYRDLSEKGDFIYPLKYRDNNCKIKLKIWSLSPINISRKFYVFPHTASGDISGASYDPSKYEDMLSGFEVSRFGIENNNANLTSYRWVADQDWGYKKGQSQTWNGSDIGNYFFNMPSVDSNDFYAEPGMTPIFISSLVNENHFKYVEGGNTYYPWRYLSENTLPSTESMIRGLTTGICFKVIFEGSPGMFQLIEGSDNEYSDNVENFVKYLKANYDTTKEPEITYERIGDSLSYKFIINGNPVIIDYSRESGNTMNYYYFFKHNDNGIQGVMGPMEYAIVRNNIYRIAVQGFNGLPTPYDPEDPDEPDKPQEEFDIMVDLKVLSWAKRDITVKW